MKKQLVVFVLFLFTSFVVSAQQGVSVGDKAPEIKLTADDSSTWNINDFLGKKNIVVYFYPAAMGKACIVQAHSYRDHLDDLQSANVVVVGISGDIVENLKFFKKAENLNFTLLSDAKGDVAKAFGVPVVDGEVIKRVVVGGIEQELQRDITAKRWTFIIGKDKKIIYKNDAVDAEKDSGDVLSFLKLQAQK